MSELESRRRVVVTGMGCLTPLGPTLPDTWARVRAGESGIAPITRFDASSLPTRFAGEVPDFDPHSVIDAKWVRRMDRFQQLAVSAAIEALADSSFSITAHNAERIGVIVGSGVGGIETFTQQVRRMDERGVDRVSPFLITMMIVDLAAGLIAILLGAKGPNFATVSACATGGHAIGEAAECIRRGDADVMLAGGADAGVVDIALASFSSMHALSRRNDAPQRASRPFDAERDGFVLGEGAGVLVLEDLEHARNRGARVFAELLGYGQSADAHHLTEPAPHGEGAARAMRAALRNAGMGPEAIEYINAHATSTRIGDERETEAIKSVFGAAATAIPISATKSMTGHLFGAAGAVESIFTVLAIQEGFLPPTINYEYPDPACDLDYIPNIGRERRVRYAMNNAYGFGGHNVSLIFGAM